jgi:hypothetical protein
MNYSQLLNINKVKAKTEVVKFFGENITENTAYHKIYDMSECEYRNCSIEFNKFIDTIINKAYFAGLKTEAEAIKKAHKHFEQNERYFNELF